MLRRILYSLLAIVLGGLAAAAWYVYDKGFTKKWRGFVAEEFRKQGIEVSFPRLTLDPFRGLVAQDVKVFDARDRRRTLAVIDQIILGINYANALRGETFLDTLDLRDTSLSLPLDPANPRGPKVEITRLNARLYLPPQQVYLASMEAEIHGLRVQASGRLIHPQAFRPKREQAGSSGELAARILEGLKAVKPDGDKPVLSVDFTGDLEKPDELFVSARLRGAKLRSKGYRLHRLELDATWRDGVAELQRLYAKDARGELEAAGILDPARREASLRLRSSLDFQELARAFQFSPPPLGELVFYDPPSVELRADATFGELPRIRTQGHVALGKFAYKSVVFENLSADAVWDGERWSVRGARLVHRTGEVTGDAIQLPEDFRAKLRSGINPRVLLPLLSGKAAEWFSQFEFTDAPAITVELRGKRPSFDECTATAELALGRTSYRGVPAQRLSATARFADRVLTLAPFQVERAEGSGSGSVAFDFKSHEVRLEKIRANVHPQEVITWIDRDLLKHVAPYRFGRRPPEVFLDGLVHTRRGKTTQLAIDVRAPGGLDYTFLKKNLHFPQASGKLAFTHAQLRISDLNAGLFHGKLRGEVEVSLQKNKPGYRALLEAEDIDFPSLTKLYFDYDTSKGKLNGDYRFSGHGGDARTMQGSGQLSVTDGNVFAIPFLGPFSGILNSIVPGMGSDEARKASARFAIRDGIIATDDFVIEGTGFSMFGNGRLHFLDDRIDFDMRLNARGLPGVLLFPMSKLFEYTSDGKLSKPVWRLKALPRAGAN
jgi:hypothetical protein